MLDDLLKKLAETADIPAETVSSAAKITVTGGSRVLIENHRGLREYGSELIAVGTGRGSIILRGEGLELQAMTAGELIITGRILSVEPE